MIWLSIFLTMSCNEQVAMDGWSGEVLPLKNKKPTNKKAQTTYTSHISKYCSSKNTSIEKSCLQMNVLP